MLRRRLSYANVVATVALVLAMSGGAMAAEHYIGRVATTGLTSTATLHQTQATMAGHRYKLETIQQISPKALAAIKRNYATNGAAGANGAPGAAGPAGAAGPQGVAGRLPGREGPRGGSGPDGRQGATGHAGTVTGPTGPQGGATATSFQTTLTASQANTASYEALFTLGDGISAGFLCVTLFDAQTTGSIVAWAPEGSTAQTRTVVVSPGGEHLQFDYNSLITTALRPPPETAETVIKILSNVKASAPVAVNGHVDGSIMTPTAVGQLDAFVGVAPPGHPRQCTVHGTIFVTPR